MEILNTIVLGALIVASSILPFKQDKNSLESTPRDKKWNIELKEVKYNPVKVVEPEKEECDQKDEVERLICVYSDKYRVNQQLALDIAKFESNLNSNAKNPHSTAKGVYQWLDSSFAHYCEGDVYNPSHNIECAIKTISEGGISHWTSDVKTRGYLISKGYVNCEGGGNNCYLRKKYKQVKIY